MVVVKKNNMLTIITLPGSAVTDITGHASDLFGDLSPIMFLVLGVLLGTLVITFLIRTLHR